VIAEVMVMKDPTTRRSRSVNAEFMVIKVMRFQDQRLLRSWS
jgi:hypothetical protein